MHPRLLADTESARTAECDASSFGRCTTFRRRARATAQRGARLPSRDTRLTCRRSHAAAQPILAERRDLVASQDERADLGLGSLKRHHKPLAFRLVTRTRPAAASTLSRF